MSINRTILVGRLTKSPELRHSPQGTAVCNFTIAVNHPFAKEGSEQKVDFIKCVCFGRPAENLANYMGKGSMVGVDGRTQTRSYDNQEGKRIFITEVVAESVQFLETKQSNQNQGNNTKQSKQSTQSQNESSKQALENAGEPVDLQDSDLPF